MWTFKWEGGKKFEEREKVKQVFDSPPFLPLPLEKGCEGGGEGIIYEAAARSSFLPAKEGRRRKWWKERKEEP